MLKKIAYYAQYYMFMITAIMLQFVYHFISRLAWLASRQIFTNYFRMQCSYFWPIMLNIMLIRTYASFCTKLAWLLYH